MKTSIMSFQVIQFGLVLCCALCIICFFQFVVTLFIVAEEDSLEELELVAEREDAALVWEVGICKLLGPSIGFLSVL